MVPGSADFAGKYGDGLISVGGKEPEIYKQLIKAFENAARAAGKDPASMPRLIELNVEFTDDPQSVIPAIQKYWAGTFIPALFDQKIYTPQMSAENGKVVGADTIQKMVCISADPQEHIRFAQQYI